MRLGRLDEFTVASSSRELKSHGHQRMEAPLALLRCLRSGKHLPIVHLQRQRAAAGEAKSDAPAGHGLTDLLARQRLVAREMSVVDEGEHAASGDCAPRGAQIRGVELYVCGESRVVREVTFLKPANRRGSADTELLTRDE